MKHQLDLQHPLQARRWLELLVEDARCGFRFRSGLDLPSGFLGFSIRTNQLGLRGPADELGSGVVLGTSFAMGISVNNGDNWYEKAGLGTGWLNLGLPVGFDQWAELMQQHHQGPKGTVLLMYHPNFWIHCQMYDRWRKSGVGIFNALHWRTDWFGCARLAVRRFVRRRRASLSGLFLSVDSASGRHPIEVWQSRMDLEKASPLIERNLGTLTRLLAPFLRVVVVRLPVKIELIPDAMRNAEVNTTLENFDVLWNRTRKCLEGLGVPGRVEFLLPDFFNLDHFHPRDSHWNKNGNQLFAEWVRPVLLGSRF